MQHQIGTQDFQIPAREPGNGNAIFLVKKNVPALVHLRSNNPSTERLTPLTVFF